jgi:hypothetical protein
MEQEIFRQAYLLAISPHLSPQNNKSTKFNLKCQD